MVFFWQDVMLLCEVLVAVWVVLQTAHRGAAGTGWRDLERLAGRGTEKL